MQKLVIEITDESKTSFVKELLNSFDYVKIKKSSPKKTAKSKTNALDKRVNELKSAFNEVEMHMQGKKQLKTLDEVLNEL